MASSSSQSQSPSQSQTFDVHKFFDPSTAPPISSSPTPHSPLNHLPQIQNPQNPNPNPNPNPFPVPPHSANFSYPPQTTQFHHHQQQHPHQFHYQFIPNPNPNPNPNPSPNLLHPPPPMAHQIQFPSFPPDPPQRSISYPTPPLQPPENTPNSGAKIMALLGTPPISPSEFPSSIPPPSVPEFSTGPARMTSSKPPRGRHLGGGDRVVYDVDVRLAGEVQPQLEVTPITKYGSDPQLVLGRQIAVNKSYICYGLKQGNIRVLNIHTALRSLFRAHTQRVTDMAFFAKEVHLLASVSVEGRLYVWRISEGPDEEGTAQITGKILIAVQIVGEGEALHPRLCWHCHKQEVLVVGYGNRVLRFDTTKVGKGEAFSAEEPLKCPVEKLIDGVQFVGKHEGEITDLSMCQWMATRLVSASMDGTVKIWEDKTAQPLVVFRPHDGQPINSATFLAAPNRPDHIVLITAGPLNREVKIWSSASEEGWLLPSDAESWRCTQTLELKSSSAARVEDAFFNQVVALSHAGLLLLANAKKNAIYAVHLEYGPNPMSTRMDYIAEFTVTMPILSFTGTSISPQGEHILQVYCVQTLAIQQYALDLSQCLPPPLDYSGLDRSESNVSRDGIATEGFSSAADPAGNRFPEIAPKQSVPMSSADSGMRYPSPLEAATSRDVSARSTESKSAALTPSTSDADFVCAPSPPLPLSPRLSRKLSGLRSPTNNLESGSSLNNDHRTAGERVVDDYSVEARLDEDSRGKKASQEDLSSVISPIAFKHPTHLITPADILMGSSSESTKLVESEANIPEVLVNGDTELTEFEVKSAAETKSQDYEFVAQEESQNVVSGSKDKYFYSQASNLGTEMARDCCALPTDTYIADEAENVDGSSCAEPLAERSQTGEEDQDSNKDVSVKVSASSFSTEAIPMQTSNTKSKKKGKGSQVSLATSPSPSRLDSIDSTNEAPVTLESVLPRIIEIQESLTKLLAVQNETQKQVSTMAAIPVAVSITKEGRRLEAALGRSTEKTIKANTDALWARSQEENAKIEKMNRERAQQITTLVGNLINKELPALLEKTLKKEMTTIGPALARTLTPVIEKAISSAVTESFQRGVGDKAVNQLDKSVNAKVEATVARQIQAQFQTSGKQALLDGLKSSFEASLIPAFEMACRAMFEQMDATFQKGMTEHTSSKQQHFENTHHQLALSLREALETASSVTQTLSSEVVDGQRKLIALAASGANASGGNQLVTQRSNGLNEKVEAPQDPTKELSRLVSEHKYEEAFTTALQRSDVGIVSWLCSQVDMRVILSTVLLRQGVLLSLLQQLSCDIQKETSRKLGWMTEVAAAINPTDPMIMLHVRPIFEQVYQILHHHRSLPTMTGPDHTSIKLLMHVINSMLMACK